MRFEDYLKKIEEAKASSVETKETITTEQSETQSGDKAITEKKVVLDAENLDIELIPLIPSDDMDTHQALKMYRKVNPEFANSVMSWD